MRAALTPLTENAIQAGQVDVKGKQRQEEVTRAIKTVKEVSSQLADRKHLNFRSLIRANLQERQTTKRKRESSVEYGIHSTPTKATIVAKSTSPFDLNWDLLKAWPQGIVDEEKAMAEYYRMLKILHIEQETKNLFINYTNDSHSHLYSASGVQKMEAEAQALKSTLKEKKAAARSIRSEIEGLCDELGSFETLQKQLQEADEWTSQIKELELELEKLRASKKQEAFSADGENAVTTHEQALQMLERQLDAMQTLEKDQGETLKAIDTAKKRLAEGLQAQDRLQQKHKEAEKQVKQAKTQKRDVKAEKACQSYQATLTVLKSLMGIVSIEAPSSTSLRCVYTVQDRRARQFCSEVAVLVYFASVGGRIKSYELQSTAGMPLTDRLAPPESQARMQLDRAVRANDASLLLQEALLCIEASS